MARSALRPLDGLEILGADSLLFISEEADPRAEAGRQNGLDDAAANAGAHAPNSGPGLEIAATAPDGTPVEPELPLGPGIGTGASGSDQAAGRPGITIGAGEITLLDPSFFGAKGGVPGPPGGGGGGDDGGGGGGGVLSEYFSGSGDGGAGYDIWIDFKGSDWTTALQQAFIDAANYLTTVITEDIGGGGKYRGKTIDDLYVTAELKAIDGPSGVLGQAGPTAVWTSVGLTAAGMMEFDTADALDFFDLGLWDDIVMHEFMHVLGFGTLWEYGSRDLVDGTNYVGPAGMAAYGGTPIPVEQDGGPGTAGGHWDEETLDNELMTGYIDGSNYLAEYSVRSLDDLGYVVDNYQDYQLYQDSLIA